MHKPYIHLYSRFATKCNIFKKTFKEDFFNFVHKQDLSTLLNLQLTIITFAASHSQKSWNSTWERTTQSMLSKTNQSGPMIFGWSCWYSITYNVSALKTKSIREKAKAG